MTHTFYARYFGLLLSAGLVAAVSAPGQTLSSTDTNESLMAAVTAPAAFAEAVPPQVFSSSRTVLASHTLPDAPSTTMLAAFAPPADYDPQDPVKPQDRGGSPHVAPIYTKYIPAGWTAQTIGAHDKVFLGLRDLYSPLTFLGDIASAGYAHLVNGQPNYGTDKGAFGQRLGATVIRDASEGVLTDAVFAPLLREDPRYYVEGPKYNFFHRVIYAGTRPIITRTDSGHSSINGAELLGYAGASAISYSYYPKINQNFRDTVNTFGGGLGGSAIGFLVSEFADQVLQAVHLEKRD